MTTTQLLADLHAKGIFLWLEGDKLRYRAPHGALPPELRSQLAQRKAEIIGFLQAGAKAPQTIPIASRTGSLPLSFAEEGLWLMDRLRPGMTVWNMQSGLRIRGALDVSILRASLNALLQRQEVLRTCFRWREGRAVREVAPELIVGLSPLVLAPSADAAAEITRMAMEDERHAFDLSSVPLFRVRLVKVAEEDHVFLFTVHHIISDATSNRLFYRDLLAFYRAHADGTPPVLDELPVQYSDYAVWVRNLDEGALSAHLEYWRGKLSGVEIQEIPADRRRPEGRSFNGAKQRIDLGAQLTEALRRLCKQEHATVFMLLVTGLKVLLYRYTGNTDVVVGSAMAGRNRPELENLVGMFINILPLRTDVGDRPSFRELLRRVREVCLEAYQHQDMPFEKLVEELNPSRGLGRNPFFQALFDVVDMPSLPDAIRGLALEFLPRPEDTARYEIVIRAPETSDGLALSIDYAVDLFSRARIAEILEQYKYLFEQIVENPDRGIDEYSLTTASARNLLPDPTAPLDSEWVGPAHKLFSEQAKRQPDAIAVIDWREQWSYGELDRRSNQLARFLCGNGIGPEDVVAVYGERNASLAWALLGVLKAGAAFFIVDPSHPAQRLKDYWDAVQPKALIQLVDSRRAGPGSQVGLFADIPACHIELPPLAAAREAGLLDRYSEDDPGVAVGRDALACVIFTSGSTGKPKGVLGRHGPLTHFLPWISQTFEISAHDRFSALAGPSSNILQREIFTALSLGATLCIPTPDAVGATGMLDSWMRKESISVAHLTPAMARVLDEGAKQPVPSVRRIFFAGDLLQMRDVDRVRRVMPNSEVINFYASSESQRAGGYTVIARERQSNEKVVPPLGRGVKGVQLLVMSSNGGLAGVGELGEIWVRSPHLARGYLGDPELTAKLFTLNPFSGEAQDRIYRTGEQGRFLPTGEVEFAGRAENQVSIRGFRIELGEIESALSYHPGVGSAVVIGREDRPEEKILVAYVVPKREPAPTTGDLRGFLKQRLPEYMVPAVFVFLSRMPMLPNGKVDRAALPEVSKTRPDLESSYAPPRSRVEKILAEIWAEILNLETVGIHDNFFDLGGHSVLAVRLAAEVEKRFRKSISAATPFMAPTISHMARVISEASEDQRSSLIAVQPHGNRPPFFCVHGQDDSILARHLGPDQPLYSLAQHLIGKEIRYTRVEEIAAHYIDEMQTVQARGPFFLGGYSLGALIAFEMARQLRQQQEDVALLVLIDPADAGTIEDRAGRHSKRVHLCGRRFKTLRYSRLWQTTSEKLLDSVQAVTCRAYRLFGRTLPAELQNFYIDRIVHRKVYDKAAQTYGLKPYLGHITVFGPEDGWDRSGAWEKVAQGGVDVHWIPRDCLQKTADPDPALLAAQLKACLDRAQNSGSGIAIVSTEKDGYEKNRSIA